MQPIVSRVEARAAGQVRFFTGVACRHGHVAERFVSTQGCMECGRLAAREWHANNREVSRANYMAWYADNRDGQLARLRAWHVANREKKKAYDKARNEALPEEARASNHNYRARKSNAEGKHTASDLARIMTAQKCKCALCRTSVKNGHHVDHIVPLAKGGSNWPNNLQILCPKCNVRKRAKDPLAFARELGMLL